MRGSVRVLVSLALSFGLVGAVAVSAPAAIAEKKSVKKFCKKALAINSDVGTSDGSDFDEDAAGEVEHDLNKLAKLAPKKKLRNAIEDMADFYGRIADGDSPEDLSDDAGDYTSAATVFSSYLVSKCLSSQIPDITIPNG